MGIDFLDLADFGELFFQRELAQFFDGQAHEQLDAPRQLFCGFLERFAPCFVALDMSRVGDTPVRGSRFAWPERTCLSGGVVAHGEDKIELRRAGRGKLIPALAAQPFGAVAVLLQPFQRPRFTLPAGLLPAL